MGKLFYRIIRKILKILYNKKILEVKRIQWNYKQFQIPVINDLGQANINKHEPWMVDLFLALKTLNPDLIIDVGVNVGQTLLKAKSVFNDILYIGFDPNPACIYYTNHLIDINNIKNCTIIPCGISDTSKLIELNFYTDEQSDSSASIVSDYRKRKIIRRSF